MGEEGLETDFSKSASLSNLGQSMTDTGQVESEVGHTQELEQEPDVEDGTLPVLASGSSRTLAEHKISTTEHNRSITEITLDPDLQTVLTGWSKLPEEVRTGIIAMVKAVESRQEM